MFKNKLAAHILSIACLLSTGYVFSSEIAQDISLANYVSHQFRISLFGIEESAPIVIDNAPKEFWTEFKKQIDPQIKTLSPREVQEIGFNLAMLNNSFEEAIIDRSFIEKLEIISGGENAQAHLFGRIFNEHINTTIGKAYTSLTLCHPVTDVTILRNRQNAIAQLISNKPYTEKINSALNNIKNLEVRTLEPWHTKPLIKAERIDAYYMKENSRFFNPLKKWRNTNSFLLNQTISKYTTPNI